MSERSEQDLLNELAERYGVASGYDDIWGHRHLTSDQTKRAILAAMGVCASTREDLQRELAACGEEPWRRPCEPVLVMRSNQGGQWSFCLPAEEGEDRAVRILWEVRDEAGRCRQSGEAGPGLVPAADRRVDGQRYVRFTLPVPSGLAIGYYDLIVCGITGTRRVDGTLRLILAPPRCYVPPRFQGGSRLWGLALQLYALRSSRNWGIGDFGDLTRVVIWAAKDLGAGVIGLNPLHALRNARPYHISPYSPDSRLYLNVLYLDVERVAEFAESVPARRLVEERGFRSKLEALRTGEMIDYDEVSAAKRAVLDALFTTFQERHCANLDSDPKPITERGRAFLHYLREEGERLETFALFQALSEALRRTHPSACVWQEWPEPYRHPASPAVAAFRATHGVQVRFHQYLQWVAGQQLEEAAGLARTLGMPVGLYHDLALASDRAGSDAWAWQDSLALGAECGAPPDAFNRKGQNWGLPPVKPRFLRASGYRMFIELLRQNLRYGGALRLDHVMGLFRLFWIPRGLPASAGAYVSYPADELLGILALESVRHEAMIIGEDLGTVPDWIREQLATCGVLSYRVFYFERTGDGTWKPPGSYPAQALTVVTTHDLPTLSGFWVAQDIAVRSRLRVYPDEQARVDALEERRRDKARILAALRREGLLPEGLADDPERVPAMTPDLCRAIHVYLSRTPSWIVLVSFEDLLGEVAQPNLPGTVDSYPNWSLKASLTLEGLYRDPRPGRLAEALGARRP